jgi:hypothetical protein
LQLREARAIETDEWSHRLGTMAHILIAANSDPEKRSDVPPWHEIFPPVSLRYRNAIAEGEPAPELPGNVAGKMLDVFVLRQKETAKKRRGRRLRRKP